MVPVRVAELHGDEADSAPMLSKQAAAPRKTGRRRDRIRICSASSRGC
jgi:hypothetical protein